MKNLFPCVGAAVGVAVACSFVRAQEDAKDAPADQPPAPIVANGPQVKEDVSVTHHQANIDGQTFAYTATAGYMSLPDYEGKPRASLFFVAYTKDGVADVSSRPITFAFNGGPGSSSVWLHLGALGPMRVIMGPEGMAPPPPYTLAPNESSWLDLTDLVFIDPVSTGYSRPAEGQQANQFHGLDEDVRAVAEFIRVHATRHQRWASPKFLAGESYGTTRAAHLSGYLQDTYGMYLNGLVLVSTVLNFQTIRFDVGNDTPFWLYLPTYTATAFYHKKLAPDLQADLRKTLDQAEAFASGEYLLALAKGDELSPAERGAIAEKVSRFTGLSRAYVEQSGLRINISNFTKELLRDQGRTVGRLDSRFKGIDRLGVGASPDFDPSMSAITGPYTATLYEYVRGPLNYQNDLVYEILTGRVNPWSYGSYENRYANVGETLRSAMSKNTNLRVLFASGYYDLATPYFASDYTMTHLGLDPSLRANISATYYESGHMMYIREADLKKLKGDVREFYRAAAPAK